MLPFNFKTFLTAVMVLGAQVAFAGANSAPTITSTPITTVEEDSVYTYAMSANDANNDDLNWTAVNKPDWLSLSSEGSDSALEFGEPITNAATVAYHDGYTYVLTNNSSNGNDKIYRLDSSGNSELFFTRDIRTFSVGMAVYNGYLYITNYSKGNITRLSIDNPTTEETVTSSYGGLGIVVKDNFAYVADYRSSEVKKLNLDTNTSTTFVNVTRPWGVGFDQSGKLWIASYGERSIYTYDGTGGSSENADLNVSNITSASTTDIKIDKNDILYVSSRGEEIKKIVPGEDPVEVSDAHRVESMTLTEQGTLIWVNNNDGQAYKLATGATLTGTPTNDDVGVHDVNLTVSDGIETVPHNFQVTVNNVNDAPTADDFNYTTDIVGSAKTFNWKTLSGAADVDVGDSIAAAIKSQGSKGNAVVNDTNITYTPNDDVNGTDSFELRIYDTNGSDVNITIGMQGIFTHNAPPSITQGADSNFSVDEDNNYNLELNATDSDSANISWSILTQGSNGTASVDGNGTSNTISYTPDKNYNGTDSFVVQVSDGISTDTITVNVTVDAVNDTPTITSTPAETTVQGQNYSYEVIATDQENDQVSFDVNTDASWLSLGSNGFDFTKVAGGNGHYYYGSSEDNGDGGLATDAKIYGYGDIVKNSDGDIYFTQNYTIRKIDATTKNVTTVAGSGNTSHYTYNSDYEIVDGTATDVNLTNANVMSINPDDGEIYFAECGVVRKFDEDTNAITTVVGKNSQGCGYYYGSSSYKDRYKLDANSWQNSNLNHVSDLKFDSAGNMYVKDSYSLVKFAQDGSVSTITKRDYDHSYSSNDRAYFEGSKAASEVGRHELQINYFDVTDDGVIYFIGYTYKKYDTSWGTSYYNIPILGKIENGTITKIKDLDNLEQMQNNEYYRNSIWFNGLEVGKDGNIYTISTEWDYDDSSSYHYYGTRTSHLVKFSSDGTELDKIEIKNDSDYVYISNFSMSADYDFYYFDNSYHASNTGGRIMKIAQKSVSISGTPTCKDIGSYSVDVNATDIHGATSTQNFTLEVTNVNDAPVFENSSAVVTEGESIGTLVKTLSASDCDSGDILTYSIVSGNEDNHFSLNETTGELTVAGNISILNKQSYLLEVNASDASNESDSAYVTISVADADLVPVASNDEVSINEENNATINILQNDSDGDNNIDVLGVTITKKPSNGKVEVKNDGNITYIPNDDFYGEDMFSYTVKDKTNLVSNEANATIVVTNVNDKPIAVADVVQTPEDVNVIFLPIKNDTDADGVSDIATINITTQPSNGDINITNGEATYSPNLNFYGTDSFEYTIADGNGTTSEAVKSYITVAEVNDIPVAYDDNMETDEDTNVTFAILDNDWDDHSILDSADSIEIIKSPENGKVVKEVNGTITYEPNKNFFGNDSFEYAVYDNNGTMSLPATVQVTIDPLNDAPVAVDDNYTIAEDTIATFNIINNDIDVEDNITNEISIETQPENGKIKSLSTGKVLYVPTSNYNGTDTFTYNIKDAKGAVSKDSATVNITITPVDDTPVLESITDLNTTEDFNDLNITLSSSDVDGDDINYTLQSSDESIATVSIVNGKVVVTPVDNASGVITVEVIASANDKNVTQSFDIEVAQVNDTPTFITTLSDTSIDEDSGVKTYELNVTDIEADDLNITVKSSDSTIVTVNQSWDKNKWQNHASYSQPLDFNLTTVDNANGEVDITIEVQDSQGASSTDMFTITVNPVNDAPNLAPISNQYIYKDTKTKSILLDITDIDNSINELDINATYTNSDLIKDINFTDDNMTITLQDNVLRGKSDINVTVDDGEYNSSKVFSFNVLALNEDDKIKEQGTVEFDENETVVVKFDDNKTVKAPTKADANGSISHEIDLGDGNSVKATSDINGTKVEITDNGVQTKFENQNVKAEVNATVTGKASHVLDIDGERTSAQSDFVGAQTTIKEDENGSIQIETSVEVDSNTTVKVTAKEDGSAEHTVKKGTLESKATSKVKGAKTVIDESGNVDTSVNTKKPDVQTGKRYEAVALTDSNGETVTKFREVDTSTNQEENSEPTLDDNEKFPVGSEVEITEDSNNTIHIQTKTPKLTEPKQFKIK